MHPALRYALIATPLAALLFLALSGFFAAWDGHVVSQRPAGSEDPAVFTVLIVTDPSTYTEADWPAELVSDLNLRVDPTGTPPNEIPADAAYTSKSRFQLYYTLAPAEGDTQVIYTTNARGLSAALLAWIAGFFGFNMWRSGSPFSWEAREHVLPELLDNQAGPTQDPQVAARAAHKKTKPPPKRRRGQGRRR